LQGKPHQGGCANNERSLTPIQHTRNPTAVGPPDQFSVGWPVCFAVCPKVCDPAAPGDRPRRAGPIRMAYLITRLCIDCLDRGCVEVCPVNCIYQHMGEPTDGRPNMLYIHPTECINCSACEPECPWHAIYEDRELPAVFAGDVAVNAQCEADPRAFAVAVLQRDGQGRLLPKRRPTADEVAENRRKWEAP